MRQLSRLRVRYKCLRVVGVRAISDRPQGKFSKPADLTKEPARTERLLGWGYFKLYYGNAADFLDAYQFALFPMGSGRHVLSLYINHYQLTTQMTIALLSGIGRNLVAGSAAGYVQVVSTSVLQLAFGVYCLCIFPTCDKATQ